MDILFYSLLFVFGLFFGSFANVIVLRLHEGKGGIFGGRSECPKCTHQLGFFDLFPLFSWIFLRGKCRYCTAPISWKYPLGELAMGSLWVFLFFFSGISFDSLMNGGDTLKAIYLLLLGFFLHILFFSDLFFTEVHRYVSLPAILLIACFLPFSFTPQWENALLGALIPTLFFGVQILLSRYIFTSRGDWVGEGDIDLGIIMGLLLGWKMVLVALFLSYILGSVIGAWILWTKGRGVQVPFGPYLLMATLLALFWGEGILQWYLGILGF